MDYFEKLKNIEKVYNHLQDDESKIIYRARINYMIDMNEEKYLNTVLSIDKEWVCEEIINANKYNKPIVIYGCGHIGRINKKTLDLCGIDTAFFCDSNPQKVGTFVDGIKVISKWELIEKKVDYFVIVSSDLYGNEIYGELTELGYQKENIYYLSQLGGANCWRYVVINTLMYSNLGRKNFLLMLVGLMEIQQLNL